MAKKLTANKAKEILHDKSVHGHPLTDKQRRFFGAIAGGAPIQAEQGGWLDKYGDEINANEGHSSAQENWMGEGYSNVGRDYSPAWGGQFQKGGKAKKPSFESFYRTVNPDFADTSNYNLRQAYESLPYTTLEAWRKDPDNNHLPDTYKLPNHPTFSDESIYFNPKTRSQAGHWNETDSSWNYMPYDTSVKKMIVEKKYAMGGSLPGAVGFTYARIGAPSNGPHAKKTLASAENGMTYYQHGLDWKPKSISRDGSVIKDDRGQWAHPGEITEIQGNTMATHGYGDIPLYVIPDKGESRVVEANTGIHKFPGATKFTEIPMAQKGKQLPPVYVNDLNDPRLKLYNDSLSTFKKSQNPWFWEGTKVTTKQDYEKKLAEQRKFPYWAFDEDQYKKDKKKGKFKDFNDYVYDVGLANKPGSREADAHQRNVGKDFEELENPIEKKLPDGRIKQYYTKYKGKILDDQYTIYDPVTGSSSTYSGNSFIGLYNPNIKPIGHVYHAFDKPYNTGGINVSSEDSEYVNKVLKNKSKKKKDYINYTYGANDAEIYKEPVQPVIYDKKKYNPNDPRLKQLQESFDRFHSSIKGKSKEEPKQPKPEPILKKQILNIEPIHTSLNYTPQIKTIEHPNIELSPIEQGNYMVGYIDENNQGVDRGFLTPEQRDVFVKELEQRNLSSVQPYRGNITEYDRRATQTKKVNQKSTGGWLDKYN